MGHTQTKHATKHSKQKCLEGKGSKNGKKQWLLKEGGEGEKGNYCKDGCGAGQ